jgi:ABC-type ATPase with predicted acetyltransferase domain
MAIWKCNKCGNTVTIEVPPDLCPSCKNKCEYVDVTCYIPECGGPDSENVNMQVFKASSDPDKA